jgi:hypothetical protein
MISSSFCCDNRLDFGQCLKTCLSFVARYHKNGSISPGLPLPHRDMASG